MHIDLRALGAAGLRLEQELEREMPRAFAMAGDLVVNEARRTGLFRDRTGRLRRSILRGPVTGSVAGGDLSLDLRAGGLGGVSYAEHVHDGTRPHVIEPSRRKALRFSGGGRFVFARRVRHPGTAPRPFMTRAFEAKAEEVGRVIDAAVRSSFARAGFDGGGGA